MVLVTGHPKMWEKIALNNIWVVYLFFSGMGFKRPGFFIHFCVKTVKMKNLVICDLCDLCLAGAEVRE